MSYNVLGDLYQENTDTEIRKSIGQYYTPDFIINYILEFTIGRVDVVKNPYVSVVDISCGAGYFLVSAYDILRDKFFLSLEKLRDKYKNQIYSIERKGKTTKVLGTEYWQEENIHYHILKNCIYGADKDRFAVGLAKKALLSKKSHSSPDGLNIIECDSLVRWEKDFDWKYLLKQINGPQVSKNNKPSKSENDRFILKYRNIDDNVEESYISKDEAIKIIRLGQFWEKKFDYIVGNPPYIGHKKLEIEYKNWLLKKYENVFKDKSDISFCFFSRIGDIISSNGISGIITSRYFMESPTGKQLRTYIMDNMEILKIVDFYGANIFKGVGVSTAIYFFKKKESVNNDIVVNKLIDDSFKFNDNIRLKETIRTSKFMNFKINQDILGIDRWILIPQEYNKIHMKIQNKAKFSLRNIAYTFQGVITGCDKAFILNEKAIKEKGIEKNILKRWIKNSNIERYYIKESNLFLIYSDLIEDEKDYINSINFIKDHRDRLENRRECKRGVRKWYHLQWGRDIKLFEQPKIVFPYKATSNRFAIDYNKNFSSADVYSLLVKDDFKEKISLEYLLGLLNSSIYEFYFKLYAKKMSKGIYDYYPNSVLDLHIITEDIIDDVSDRVKKIIKLHSEDIDVIDKGILNAINKLELEIDIIIGNYFGFDEKEYKLIYEYLGKK